MAKEATKETKVTTEDYLNERVPYTIHRPADSKEEFTTVTVNGKNYQIEYGKTVMIPRFVRDVIENSYKAQAEASAKQKEYTDLYTSKAGAL